MLRIDRLLAWLWLAALALLPGGCASDSSHPFMNDPLTGVTDGDQVARGPDHEPINIYTLLQSDPRFTTFCSLLEQVNLATPMQVDGFYTVFAPTESALRALSAAELARLQRPEARSRLKEIVSQHIISGWINLRTDRCQVLPDYRAVDGKLPRIPDESAKPEAYLHALNGNPLTIRLDDSTALIAGLVTAPRAGIWCRNGWVYPIDRLLEPPRQVTLLARLADEGRFRQMLAAVVRSQFTTWLRQERITQVTLLALTDDVIAAAPPELRASLEGHADAVREVLLRHAIRGAISRETLRASRTITTLDGISRPVTVARDGTVRIDGVAI
ncbi:MAG: fasciclin domain-containing protein, partial [Planctomycetota bacterium]